MTSSVFTLRVSVLENCQLRCTYCLPNNQPVAVQKSSWLNVAQYEILAQSFAQLAVQKVRFTGGEPLLRPDLPNIVHAFVRHMPHVERALTTNGLGYEAKACELKQAGLDAITFHLDTLQESRYPKVMGKGSVAKVRAAITAAAGMVKSCKLNVVIQKGINDDEMVDFIYFAHAQKITVRFIELMNTGSARPYVAKHFMSGAEILSKLAERFALEPLERAHKSAPAESFFIKELSYRFGLIASDTRPFCHNCDRLRLSADGFLRTCLYEPHGAHLGFSQEKSPSVSEVLARITEKIVNKTSFHPSITLKRRVFSMSQTGG